MTCIADLQCEKPGSIPGSGRSPREADGNPLQYSCLENPMDGGAWRATVHGVPKESNRTEGLTLSLSQVFHTQPQRQDRTQAYPGCQRERSEMGRVRRSVQFSCSVMSNSLQPIDGSTPGFPVLHYLPDFVKTHIHGVSDAIQ